MKTQPQPHSDSERRGGNRQPTQCMNVVDVGLHSVCDCVIQTFGISY